MNKRLQQTNMRGGSLNRNQEQPSDEFEDSQNNIRPFGMPPFQDESFSKIDDFLLGSQVEQTPP